MNADQKTNQAQSSVASLSGSLVSDGFVEELARHLSRRLLRRGDEPLDFSGDDLVLRNTAGLTRVGFDHRSGTRLQRACTARRYQDVAVIAIKAFHQFHGASPATASYLGVTERSNDARIGSSRSRTFGSKHLCAVATNCCSAGESLAPERRNRSANTIALRSLMDFSRRSLIRI